MALIMAGLSVAQEAVIVAKIAQLVLMCKRGGGMGKLTPDVHEKGAVRCAAPFYRLMKQLTSWPWRWRCGRPA
jgi:hypothetical protein